MPSPSPPPPRPLSILGYLSHLSRIELFSSPSCYLLVGSKEQQGDRRKRRGEEGGEYRVLRVLRSEGGEGEGTDLRIVPDAEEYSQSALELLLRSLSPVTSLCVSFGLVGTIKFLDCYYITLITRRQKVGQVGGEPVYSIKSTEMVPLRGCIEGERAPEGEGEGGEEGGRRGELGGEGGAPTGGVISSLIHLTKQTVGLGLSQAEIEELRYHVSCRTLFVSTDDNMPSDGNYLHSSFIVFLFSLLLLSYLLSLLTLSLCLSLSLTLSYSLFFMHRASSTPSTSPRTSSSPTPTTSPTLSSTISSFTTPSPTPLPLPRTCTPGTTTRLESSRPPPAPPRSTGASPSSSAPFSSARSSSPAARPPSLS